MPRFERRFVFESLQIVFNQLLEDSASEEKSLGSVGNWVRKCGGMVDAQLCVQE